MLECGESGDQAANRLIYPLNSELCTQGRPKAGTGMSTDTSEKPQVLVVDDSKVIRRAAIKMLSKDYQVHEAVNGEDGWQQLQRNDAISVVFTDMQMPEVSGIELLRRIRKSEDDRLAALPVIMITGADDSEEARSMVYDAGVTDFITKPFQSFDIISRARACARLSNRVVELENRSCHDSLTGLYRSSSFEELGEKAFSFAQRHELQLSAACVEIEGFDDIYLAHGRSVAQQIISAVGKRIEEEMRAEDVAAHLSVARYAVLLPMMNGTGAGAVMGRICENANRLVFKTGRGKIPISLAAGYTLFAKGGQRDFKEMMAQADSALQRALKDSAADKIACFGTQYRRDHKQEIPDDDIRRAVNQILNGAYTEVPDHMLQTVADKLSPFLDYVANRSDTGLTGTDDV